MTEEKITTIQIDLPTRDRLKNLGKKGETYQDIINRLIEQKPDSTA